MLRWLSRRLTLGRLRRLSCWLHLPLPLFLKSPLLTLLLRLDLLPRTPRGRLLKLALVPLPHL